MQDKGEVASMTEEEARAFLQAAEADRYYALWTLLLTTGARPSEALALQWRDLGGNRLHIRRSLNRRGVDREEHPEGWELVPPKTKKGKRKVVLPPLALDALARHQNAQRAERLKPGSEYAKHPGGGFIFATPEGEPLDQTNLYRRNFRKVLRVAGLGTWEGEGEARRFVPGFTMYSLRHSFASLDLRAGGNVKVTSAVLGHSDVALTLNTYTHLVDAQQDQVADRMQSLLGEAATIADLPGALQALAEAVGKGDLNEGALESLARLLAGFARAHGVASVEGRLFRTA
jgi:integrase